jgi:hypothetical protein
VCVGTPFREDISSISCFSFNFARFFSPSFNEDDEEKIGKKKHRRMRPATRRFQRGGGGSPSFSIFQKSNEKKKLSEVVAEQKGG